jgi:quinol monooxygenase YgiN
MIYQTAAYQVKPNAVEAVKAAIEDFTDYVKASEPGTILYIAWQKKDDPTSFMHFFIFEDEKAQDIHSKSTAVKKFESIYKPLLVSSGVSFTDFNLVSINT